MKTIDKIIGVIHMLIKLFFLGNKVKVCSIKNYLGKNADIRIQDNGKISIKEKLYLSERTIIGAYKNGELTIGTNNFFNTNCNITCYSEISIGDNNLFGQNVIIIDHNHRRDTIEKLICKQDFDYKSVHIGSDCWICANVVICPGARIGDHITVAANAVVTSKLLEPGVYAGIPAKRIKGR